jgi:hypothetical protein
MPKLPSKYPAIFRLMPGIDRTSSFRQRILWAALLLMVGILPTLLVRFPATEDYLDHLGQMYILATAGTNEANPYYQVSWTLYPYLAMDIIVPLLARVMDVQTAGWLFFLASQLLVVTGAMALELSVKGRHQIAGVAAILTLYSLPFSFGLVNFEFGTGIALWGIASWISLRRKADWPLRNAVHAGFVVVLFLSHFFALAIYGLTIGLFELRQVFASKSDTRRILITLGTLIWPVAVILMIMFLLMKRAGGGTSVLIPYNEWWFSWKPIWLLLFLNGYSISLAAGSAAALTVLLFYSWVKGGLSISPEGKWIGLGFLLCFLAMPFKLFSANMYDIRMILAAFLILPAFVTFAPPTKSFGSLMTLVTSGIIAVNIGYVSYVWFSYRSDYAAMVASFSLIRQGSFVLVASSPSDTPSTLLTDVPMSRAPTLAVHYAKALVSSLYISPGMNIALRPDLKRLEVWTTTPPSLATLELVANGGEAPLAQRYIRNWTHDFDYVYLLGPPRPNVLPDVLDELTAERRFTLYRVRK